MSWYELLLFVHVAMAVIWVGGGLMMQLFGVRASRSGDPARLAAVGHDIEWIGLRVFVPASLLAFLSGVLLVVESDAYGFGDDWIVVALVLYGLSFVSGLLFFGPESGRVGKLIDDGSAEAGPRMRRLVFLARLELVALFLIIYAMTVKPDFGDAGSILWGVAGAVVATGLLYWRYRLAQGQAPPTQIEASS